MLLHAVQRRKKRRNNQERPAPRRCGGAIKLVPEAYKRYRELHDNVWPQVLQRMYESNIRNFTIYYHKETSTLFQSFEWTGHWTASTRTDEPLTKEQEQELFDRDMAAIANDPITRKWWVECEPCQEPFGQWKSGSLPLSQGGSGDWWGPLECVCHCGYWPTAYSNESHDPDFVKLEENHAF